MKYLYIAVDRMPKPLAEGIVYHSETYEIGALLCACGCGHRVSLLVPDSHQVTSEGGLATVRPSISVCDAPCKSHYVISAGQVEWLPAFSEGVVASVMRAQIARHAASEVKRQSWFDQARTAMTRLYRKLRSRLRL